MKLLHINRINTECRVWNLLSTINNSNIIIPNAQISDLVVIATVSCLLLNIDKSTSGAKYLGELKLK